MAKSVYFIKYIQIIIFVLCGWCKLFAAEQLLRTEKELIDAVARISHLAPTLLGKDFTKHDAELFAAGTKLEDVNLNIDDLILKYGYAVEKYDVTTEDDYILTLFRIPSTGRPIFLMHGLFLSADDWVTPGPESGLAYLFATEGFDVWMGNARGTKHSSRHKHLSTKSAAFWDFSWDEIGRYDLPAMIDFVLYTTRQSQLIYIGHSQGTTSFFVLGSERPEYNHKISLMIALAPAAAIPNLNSPFMLLFKYATLQRPEKFIGLARKAGLNALMPKDTVAIAEVFAKVVCANSQIARAICSSIIFLVAGFSYNQMNVTNLPVVLSHVTSGVSTKQVEHYAQSVTFKKFQRFDYGKQKNRVVYGSMNPPEYDVGAITTPVAMFYSADDWLATEADAKTLRSKMNNVVDFYKVPYEFSHLDFVYAKDLKKLFSRMLNLIKDVK